MAVVRGGLNPATRGNRRISAPLSGLDVRDFPSLTLPAGKLIYRIHRDGHSPWWFSRDGSQRFDLPTPYGTCYVADQPMGAFLETLTRFVVVPVAEVAARRLATLTLTDDLRLADCHAPAAAGYGVTATTSAGYPYEACRTHGRAASGGPALTNPLRRCPSSRARGSFLRTSRQRWPLRQ